jgi:hypothetical protein
MIHLNHHFEVWMEVKFVVTSILIAVGALLIGSNVTRHRVLTRRTVGWIALIWVSFCSAEYWLFGSFSALGSPDEYHASIPFLYYRTHMHGGGEFAHGFAGGVDAGVGLGMGAQLISIEYGLFRFLPLWLGVLALNAGAIALAFAGGYRLARACMLTRSKAVLVAMVASAGHPYLFDQAAGGIGWAIAALPGAFYLIAQRSQRPRYYLPILTLALVFPGPVHELLSLLLALALSIWLIAPENIGRAVRGAALFTIVVFVNWLPWLVSVLNVSPEIARASVVEAGVPIWYMLLPSYRDVIILPIALVCLTVLVFRHDWWALRAATALGIVVCLGPALTWVNWTSIGLPFLAAYRWNLLADAYILVAVVIMARTLGKLRWEGPQLLWGLYVPPLSLVYFVLVPVISAADHKAANIINLRLYGGQALFSEVRCLKDDSWKPPDPFRVVTVPTLMSPSTTTAYGLDAIDGMSPGFVSRSGEYFGFAVQRLQHSTVNAQYHFMNVPDGANQLTRSVNLDALRIANVRFVISDRKLMDPALRLVADCSTNPTLATESALARWTELLAPGALVRPHLVYELKQAWPRIYVPTSVRISAADASDQAFYDELLDAPWPPSAQIAASDFAGSKMDLSTGSLEVTEYSIIPSGFDLRVRRNLMDSSSRGLIVINVPYSRFWHAMTADRALPILPVNGIHFAIIVDGDPGHIQVRYEPPSLSRRVTAAIGHPL